MPRLLATGYINKPFYVCVLKWSNQITIEPEPELSSFLRDVKTQQLFAASCKAPFVRVCGNSSCLELPGAYGSKYPLDSEGCCVDGCLLAGEPTTLLCPWLTQRNLQPWAREIGSYFLFVGIIWWESRATDLKISETSPYHAPIPNSCWWPYKRPSSLEVWADNLCNDYIKEKWR